MDDHSSLNAVKAKPFGFVQKPHEALTALSLPLLGYPCRKGFFSFSDEKEVFKKQGRGGPFFVLITSPGLHRVRFFAPRSALGSKNVANHVLQSGLARPALRPPVFQSEIQAPVSRASAALSQAEILNYSHIRAAILRCSSPTAFA